MNRKRRILRRVRSSVQLPADLILEAIAPQECAAVDVGPLENGAADVTEGEDHLTDIAAETALRRSMVEESAAVDAAPADAALADVAAEDAANFDAVSDEALVIAKRSEVVDFMPLIGKTPALSPRRMRRPRWLRITANPEPSFSEQDWQELVEELAKQLEVTERKSAEKDELIGALTDRLEQAAEQLDRMKRSGANLNRRGAMGLPSDIVEDHRATIEDLKQVLSRWETMQFESSLGQITTQLGELRELVVESLHSGDAAPRASSLPAAAHSAHAPQGANWWERQKAAMLAGEPMPDESGIPVAAHAEVVSDAASEPNQAEMSGESSPFEMASARKAITELPPLPEAIVWDELTLEVARTAIIDRDNVIRVLHEVALQYLSADLPGDASHGADMPEWVRDRLAALEEQWMVKFRQTELDLSIERARISRSESQIKQREEQLAAQQRQNAGHAVAAANAGDTTSNRRWFRFLKTPEENS